jgi:hypothetical protein
VTRLPDDDEPLIGDADSSDDSGWEAPTRPDRPRPPAKPTNGAPRPRTPDENDPFRLPRP